MGKSTRADGVVVPADGRGLVSPAGAVLLRETMRAAVLARAACQPGWPGGGRRGRPVTRGKVIADLAAAVAPGGECLAAITVPRGQPELAGPVASDPVVNLVAGSREEDDDLAAFAAFADLEDAFEPVEALVMQLLTEVEIQRDLASGR